MWAGDWPIARRVLKGSLDYNEQPIEEAQNGTMHLKTESETVIERIANKLKLD